MNRIEFVEESHQYLLDGVLIPSVSDLVHFKSKVDLSKIPCEILKRAGEFGSSVHSLIETYESGFEPVVEGREKTILDGWIKLCEKEAVRVLKMEQIVYTDKFAGRYDVLGEIDGEKALIDIKTNGKYPKEHLEIQMGLYKYALNQDIDTYCMWFEKYKDKWHLKKVDSIGRDDVEKLVEEYYEKFKK